MNKVWLIAQRELKERIKSRSFVLMATLGPIIVLALTYFLFAIGGSEKQHWKVLVMDKQEIMNSRLMPKQDPKFSFDFINDFVDYDEFAHQEKFNDYDLSVWINEKVLTNKTVIISYRERPSEQLKRRLIHHLERRLEEIMVNEFTALTVADFRAIKQPLNFSFKNTYDPREEESYLSGWVGFTFGGFIILFTFLFGMTILRGVAKEKANRIVEVLLAAVSPKQLLSGKLLGIGITAIVQFIFWTVIIGVGLYIFRQVFFPDMMDPALLSEQMSEEVAAASQEAFKSTSRTYNDFVDLVYKKIQFSTMLFFFVLFFIGGFLFYGSFFSMIGASIGSESDGQQFLIPIVLILLASVFAGYHAIYFPTSELTLLFAYLPFTSPIVMMVKLGYGFEDGSAWQLYLSLFCLFLFAIAFISIAGRIYKNGILQFGHRLKWSLFIKWLRKQ